MMRKVLFVGAALLAVSLTGCDLYYGNSNNSNCAIWGCEGEVWPTDPVAPGDACAASTECAAGCYCDIGANESTGTCVETGFCDRSSDCAIGFECDDRATCVPVSDQCRDGVCPDSCVNTGCPVGASCDQATGLCVANNGCTTESDCGPGFGCAPDGTCVPTECRNDGDCLEGCYCDGDGTCQETGFCNVDSDCAMQECDAAGQNCTPMECDEERNTCRPTTTPPPPPPLASCNGDISCSDGAPSCGADEAAEIVDGCYTGNCIVIDQCSSEPLARCSELADFESCDARSDCWAQYIGTNCTCDTGDPNGPVACNCANPPPDENGNPSVCICANWNFSCRSN